MRLQTGHAPNALAAALCATVLTTSQLTPAAHALDCNANTPCQQNVDFGSCGNACCAVEFMLKGSTANAATGLKKVLSDGGPDGQWSLPPLTGGRPGFNDLSAFGVPADYIGQAVHTTALRDYQDTVNLAVRPGAAKGMSVVRAFSISDIGGALGDRGQNYRNLEMLMDSMKPAESAQVIFGCGK